MIYTTLTGLREGLSNGYDIASSGLGRTESEASGRCMYVHHRGLQYYKIIVWGEPIRNSAQTIARTSGSKLIVLVRQK